MTYRMPFLFGSAVGMAYSLDREDKFDRIVGAANYESDAMNLVEALLIEQGQALDHRQWYLSVNPTDLRGFIQANYPKEYAEFVQVANDAE